MNIDSNSVYTIKEIVTKYASSFFEQKKWLKEDASFCGKREWYFISISCILLNRAMDKVEFVLALGNIM